MLLQKVNHESDKPGSGSGLKLAFYVASLAVAFIAGRYSDHSKNAATAPEAAPDTSITATSTPADTQPAATPEPTVASQETAAAPATPRPTLISETPTPMPVQKAVAVTHMAPAPVVVTPPVAAPIPAKQANDVTITEPVEIPVKQDGKITGYINLQKGQTVTPLAVENDQIKIKAGAGFVMVPVKSTDMAR